VPASIRPGAVHLHRAVLDALNSEGGIAFVHAGIPGIIYRRLYEVKPDPPIPADWGEWNPARQR
jgi:hypothetical protein